MGEAKRKNKQVKQVEEALRERIRAGEFGGPGAMDHVCVVLDKSPHAADTLKALRSMPEAAALVPLLESLELQLWAASALFPFAVLAPLSASVKERVLLAASLDKLDGILAKAFAAQAAAGKVPGVLIAVTDEVDGVIRAKVRRLQSN